jgi:superfamily I DNA/RNA helicase
VRDILSVARLMLDHDDNLAFRKCLSTNLASGIGKISIQELRNIAEKKTGELLGCFKFH